MATTHTDGPNALDIALGNRIRQRRKGLGVSQTTLAEAIGLTFQQVQKYERGFNRVSFSRLVDIAHALDCRVIDLVGDLDDGVAQPSLRSTTDSLRAPGAADLLAAYADASRPIQRVVLKLVQALAADARGRSMVDADDAEGAAAG